MMPKEITPQTHRKNFSDMTLQELKEEAAYWDKKISEAISWGASVGVAHEFAREAKRWIQKREAQ